MSQQPNHENESQQAASELGALLRQERTRRKLSIGDVSEQLKLPIRQIEALEQADFSKLPEPVFVRGFLRSYGRYLNIDESILNHHLDQIVKRPELARAIPKPTATGDNAPKMTYHQTSVKKPFPTWILGIGALALIIGGIYMWQSKSRQDNRDQEAQNQIVPPATPNPTLPPNVDGSDVQVLAMTPPVASTPEQSASTPAASETASASTPTNTQTSDGRLQTAQGELAIRVRFRSYLTVTDANGQMLISRLVAAGSEHRFQGNPPYRVRIGFAKDSMVSYSGRDINVREHMRDSKTALFNTDEATNQTKP